MTTPMHMRMMERNKKPFYYANYLGQVEIIDEDGNNTGQYEASYDTPVLVYGNISPDRGETSDDPFGILSGYQRILQLPDPDAPITETTICWIEQNDTSKPHDYKVVGVARSLESARFALARVTVS